MGAEAGAYWPSLLLLWVIVQFDIYLEWAREQDTVRRGPGTSWPLYTEGIWSLRMIYDSKYFNIPLEEDTIYESRASTILCCVLTIFQHGVSPFINIVSFNLITLREVIITIF